MSGAPLFAELQPFETALATMTTARFKSLISSLLCLWFDQWCARSSVDLDMALAVGQYSPIGIIVAQGLDSP